MLLKLSGLETDCSRPEMKEILSGCFVDSNRRDARLERSAGTLGWNEDLIQFPATGYTALTLKPTP